MQNFSEFKVAVIEALRNADKNGTRQIKGDMIRFDFSTKEMCFCAEGVILRDVFKFEVSKYGGSLFFVEESPFTMAHLYDTYYAASTLYGLPFIDYFDLSDELKDKIGVLAKGEMAGTNHFWLSINRLNDSYGFTFKEIADAVEIGWKDENPYSYAEASK